MEYWYNPHKKVQSAIFKGGSECTNVPVDWRPRLTEFRNIMESFKTKTRIKIRMTINRKIWMTKVIMGTGSVEMDDARHHHTHARRHALPSATRNCSRYPWLPCAPQLHCYSATATPNPNTAYTAICHCLSLDHYRPPCGIGKTGLAIKLRLLEHQGSIPSIPWKQKYHYQLL
jgi:hypothetical protein